MKAEVEVSGWVLVLEILGLGTWADVIVTAKGVWMSGGGRKGLSFGWKAMGWKVAGEDWRCV